MIMFLFFLNKYVKINNFFLPNCILERLLAKHSRVLTMLELIERDQIEWNMLHFIEITCLFIIFHVNNSIKTKFDTMIISFHYISFCIISTITGYRFCINMKIHMVHVLPKISYSSSTNRKRYSRSFGLSMTKQIIGQ